MKKEVCMKKRIMKCMLGLLLGVTLIGCGKEKGAKTESIANLDIKPDKDEVLYEAKEYIGPTSIFADLYPERYITIDGTEQLMPMTVRDYVDMLGVTVGDITSDVIHWEQFEDNKAYFFDTDGNLYLVKINTEKYHYEHEDELYDIDVFLDQELTGLDHQMWYQDDYVLKERMPFDELEMVGNKLSQMYYGYEEAAMKDGIDYVLPNYMILYQFVEGTLPESHYGTAKKLIEYMRDEMVTVQIADITGDGYDDMVISSELGDMAFGVNMEDGKLYELYVASAEQTEIQKMNVSGMDCLFTSFKDESDGILYENAYHVDFNGDMKLLVSLRSDGRNQHMVNNKNLGEEYAKVRGDYDGIPHTGEYPILKGMDQLGGMAEQTAIGLYKIQDYYKKLREGDTNPGEYEEIFDIEKKEVWQEPYRNIIEAFVRGDLSIGDDIGYCEVGKGSISGVAFSLYDINNDAIPELFIGYQNERGFMNDSYMFQVDSTNCVPVDPWPVVRIDPKEQKIQSCDMLCENYPLIGKLMNAYNLKRYFGIGEVDANLEASVQNAIPTDVEDDAELEQDEGWEDWTVLYYLKVDAPDGYVNFRLGPSTENPIIAEIPNGVILPCYSSLVHDKWYQVGYDNQYGFVAASQVTRDGLVDYNPVITEQTVREALGVPAEATVTIEYGEAYYNEGAGCNFVCAVVTGTGDYNGYSATGEFEITEGWLGGGVLVWNQM